jgi:hypothetical protein
MTFSAPARARGHAARLLALALLASPVIAACSTPATAPSFAAMPAPGPNMAAILGPVTGTGPRTITITARHRLRYTLSCLGRHVVWLRATPNIAGFAIQCDDGGVFGGGTSTTPGREVGARVSLRIAAPSGTTWELRVDGSPP